MRRWVLGAILILHFALGVAYSVAVPLWEAPDEPDHYQYAWYLSTYRRLPTEMIPLLFPDTDETHQPPLYYVIGALGIPLLGPQPVLIRQNPYFSWGPGPTRNVWVFHNADEWFPYREWVRSAHAMRVLSALFGVAVVWTVYRLSLVVFPDRPWLAVGAAAFQAFRPGLLASSGSVGNDTAVGFFASLTLVVAATMWASGVTRRRALALGTSYGLALIAKENALALGPVVALWPTWLVFRERGLRWRAALRPALQTLVLVAVPTALIAGWWFGRNLVLTGAPIQRELSGFSELPPSAVSPLRIFEAAPMYNATWWGSFGWQLLFLPTAWNVVLGALFVLALVGLGLAVWRLRRRPQLAALAWLALAILLVLAITEVRRQLSPQPGRDHARYWLPALAPIGMMLWLGVVELSNRLRLRWAPGAICVGLLGLAAVVPVAVIKPNFPEPVAVRPSAARWPMQHAADATFGGQLRLAGYDAPASAQKGQEIDVRLYWEVLAHDDVDRTAFVHVVDAAGVRQGQVDTSIGTFEYGTSRLLNGETARTDHPIHLPADLAPGRYTIEVGAYPVQAPAARLPVAVRGLGVATNAIRLATFDVPGPADPALQPHAVVFGGALKLTGARIPAEARAGAPLDIALDWQPIGPIDRDYKLFVHVVDSADRPLAQGDRSLDVPGYPATAWQPGETLRTTSSIPLDGALEAGRYRVLVGLYDPAQPANRLPIASADVPAAAGAATVSTVDVK